MTRKLFVLVLSLLFGFNLFAQEYAEIQYTNDADGLSGERFANCMAASNSTLAVGSPQKKVFTNTSQGYVHIYEKITNGVSYIKRISASDGEASDLFGTSVAISGDILVVGAQNKTVGANFFQGAVYVFSRNEGGANNWGLLKKITASDGASNDFFGHAVAINANYIAVSAYNRNSKAGAIYLFGKNQGGTNNWGETKILTASDGAANDYLGQSLAINSGFLAAGASGVQASKGAVYLYDLASGAETKKIMAADGMASDEFGYSVAMNENVLLVGARNNSGYQGAVYLFDKNTNWAQKKKLVANDATGGDAFGSSVALSANAAIIGARVKKVGANVAQGAAYIFAQNQGGTNNWGQGSKITANDGGFAENFGEAVAFMEEDVLVAAPSHKIVGKSTLGQIYFYKQIGGKVPNIEGTYYADESITDKSGWTHYWNSSNGYLILSLKLGGSTLGTKLTTTPVASTDYAVGVHLAATAQKVTAPYVTNPNGWWAAPSSWYVKSSKVPFNKNIPIRTYFYNNDIQTVIDSVNAHLGDIQSLESLKFFVLPKGTNAFYPTHDNADSVAYVGYGQTSSDSTWTSGSWNGKMYAETMTKSIISGGLAAAGGAGEPFPSHIQTITAVNQLAVNEIAWAINKNSANKVFEIEHSRDQITFSSIGTISKDQPDGNDSTAIFFSFKDYQPFGKTYYRLKQVDDKGLITYSRQAMARVQDTLLMYPSPAEDQVNILYSYSYFKSPYSVRITNMQGEVVWNAEVESEDGAGIIRIDVGDLPTGVYVINAKDSLNQLLGQSRFVKK